MRIKMTSRESPHQGLAAMSDYLGQFAGNSVAKRVSHG